MPITLTDYLEERAPKTSHPLSALERIDLAIKIVLALNKLHLNTPPQYLKGNRVHSDDILIDGNEVSFEESQLSKDLGPNFKYEEVNSKYDQIMSKYDRLKSKHDQGGNTTSRHCTPTEMRGRDNNALVDSIFVNLFTEDMNFDFWRHQESQLTSDELLHRLEYFKFTIQGQMIDDSLDKERRVTIQSAEHLTYILSRYKGMDTIINYNFDKTRINEILSNQNEHMLNTLSSILKRINPLTSSYISWIQESIDNIWPKKAPEFDSIICLKKQEGECSQDKLLQTKHKDDPDLNITPSDSATEKDSSSSALSHSNTQSMPEEKSKAEKLFDDISTLIDQMTAPKAGWKERWSLAPKENEKIMALTKVKNYLQKNGSTINTASLKTINKLVLNICQYKRHTMDFRETHSLKEFKNMYKDQKEATQVMSHTEAKQLIETINNTKLSDMQAFVDNQNTAEDSETTNSKSKMQLR